MGSGTNTTREGATNYLVIEISDEFHEFGETGTVFTSHNCLVEGERLTESAKLDAESTARDQIGGSLGMAGNGKRTHRSC